ncbi:MAG: hypothetical protein H6922_04030 [Pseudomonadaceae bacterium]|nr:hypothetical protein [Pseudomonadaceae bacterium]
MTPAAKPTASSQLRGWFFLACAKATTPLKRLDVRLGSALYPYLAPTYYRYAPKGEMATSMADPTPGRLVYLWSQKQAKAFNHWQEKVRWKLSGQTFYERYIRKYHPYLPGSDELIEKAQECLFLCEPASGHNGGRLHKIDSLLKQVGKPPEYIDLTEEYREELLTSGYMAEARNWLNHARTNQGHANNEDALACMNKWLMAARQDNLSGIGSTPEEYARLRRDGAASRAARHLQTARAEGSMNVWRFKEIRVNQRLASTALAQEEQHEMLLLLANGFGAARDAHLDAAFRTEDAMTRDNNRKHAARHARRAEWLQHLAGKAERRPICVWSKPPQPSVDGDKAEGRMTAFG